MIPKIIHYCWYGGVEKMPYQYRASELSTRHFQQRESLNGMKVIVICISISSSKMHIIFENGHL